MPDLGHEAIVKNGIPTSFSTTLDNKVTYVLDATCADEHLAHLTHFSFATKDQP